MLKEIRLDQSSLLSRVNTKEGSFEQFEHHSDANEQYYAEKPFDDYDCEIPQDACSRNAEFSESRTNNLLYVQSSSTIGRF